MDCVDLAGKLIKDSLAQQGTIFPPQWYKRESVIARRRATQHTRLLIREPDLHAIVGSQELVIADTRQQMELHQLNHHDSAAYGCDPRGTQLRTLPFRQVGIRDQSVVWSTFALRVEVSETPAPLADQYLDRLVRLD